jgi:hypothetical protein
MNVATTTWHYKYNNAALFGNVKACNTVFKYDYQIQEVLNWQQISKPKRNTNQHNFTGAIKPVTLVLKHGAESSKNRALSKRPKIRRLLPNLLEPSQSRASRKRRIL